MSQLLHNETIEQQRLLANYCRNGEPVEIKGVTENRIPHYRRLVYNVILESLSSTYPLTVNLLTTKEWNLLVQSFFEEHTCLDPQVWRMPKELISYVEQHQNDLIKKYPHLADLLLFEWLEVEYYMMSDQAWPPAHQNDFWQHPWNLNPESEIVALNYPVHLKNARFISPTDKGNYFCLIFRNPENHKVRFLNLSPFLAWMLNQMRTAGASLTSLDDTVQSLFGIDSLQAIEGDLERFHQKLTQEGMLKAT